ncbi:transcriptional repressor LexA [Candidatus Symbiobacter mobilis]|uniref:LexA repressor n=1 Tax=Candidatus Symbiobacter mobilis CR TaxID=946483 RepID=U5NAC1_9BURK|nr:transcriptional repressor LexA [Candidatus Symbiobacter mobilis]AGX88270.1 repressor LexA [Candidatus Symbiobacter mobilis CR]
MSSSPTLTPCQRRVLDFLQDTIVRTGVPPTRAEVATALGFRSANAAQEHLQALARKGVIELGQGSARGIRIPGHCPGHFPADEPMGAVWTLPLVGRVAAGLPILAQEHLEGSYPVAAGLFAQRPDYLLRVQGTSMLGAGILDGDLLAIHACPEAQTGQIVVARIGEEVTVKRLVRTDRMIELHPENPQYPVLTVTAEQPFAIEGIVVGLIRPAVRK